MHQFHHNLWGVHFAILNKERVTKLVGVNMVTVVFRRPAKITWKDRVKSGMFGQTVKFGQQPCLFHISIIGIKNKLTKQTVENPDETAHKEPSHLNFHWMQMLISLFCCFTRAKYIK